MNARILLVEDDPDLADLAALHMRDQGWEVVVEGDGGAAAERLQKESFDLLVLDLMLPGVDGLEICRRLRGEKNYTPILILTARSSELDRVLGLELGADDYLSKPVSFRELVARVRAALRRSRQWSSAPEAQDSSPSILNGGPIHMDLNRREVRLHGAGVELTAKEFELLHYFLRNPHRVFSRADLLAEIWGFAYEGYEHTVNSHINRLRGKIERDPKNPEFIRTVWGVGYKFTPPES
ncbi:MAG: DNA-binding response regulator [Planctomycetota bacterium]|nr:MAG: DNA-binding response regulator [Planctomycetota bacterium]